VGGHFGELESARKKLADAFTDRPKLVRILFVLNIRTGFAQSETIVSDKAFKSFRFNLLPMSGI
jgi:hypothetical protein